MGKQSVQERQVAERTVLRCDGVERQDKEISDVKEKWIPTRHKSAELGTVPADRPSGRQEGSDHIGVEIQHKLWANLRVSSLPSGLGLPSASARAEQRQIAA